MSRHNFFHKSILTVLSLSLAMTLLPIDVIPVYGQESDAKKLEQQEAATQQAISNLEKQTQETKNAINTLQGQKAAALNKVDNLEDKTEELQAEADGYTKQLDAINEEIQEAEDAMSDISAKVVEMSTQLSELEAQEQKTYEELKHQMHNSYQNGGNNNLLLLLLTSGSFKSFLNTTEYLDAIVGYNHRKISHLKELQAEVKEKKSALEKEQVKIDDYQAELDEKHQELAELTDEVMSNLDDANSALSSEKNKIANFSAQIVQLDKTMKALAAQQAAAQAELAKQIAARQAASGSREYTGGAVNASESELQWLAATIQAEADGESYTGKLGVGSVILNRVKSSSFPNSIKGVITQNMQFASYRSGKVELIVRNGPNSTCIKAAQEVLGGARIGDYLFFMTKYYADYYGIKGYTMIGNHAFFYSWSTNNTPSQVTEPDEDKDEPTDDSQNVEETPVEDDSDEDSNDSSDDDSDDNSEEDEDQNEESKKKKKKKKKKKDSDSDNDEEGDA